MLSTENYYLLNLRNLYYTLCKLLTKAIPTQKGFTIIVVIKQNSVRIIFNMLNKLIFLSRRLLSSENQRSNLLKKNIVLSLLIKFVGILTSFLLVPLTINYINSELYGIWLTLTSIVIWIGFFDFGCGNGLRNKLAEALALEKYHDAKIYVSSTYCLFFLLFSILGGILFFVVDYINWAWLLNISYEYNSIIKKATQILIITSSARMIIGLISHVIYAYQLSALSSLLDVLGNILSLVFIYILTLTLLPNFIYVTIAFSIAPLIVLLLFSIYLYSTKFQKVRPNIFFIDFSYTNNIFKLGGVFFILQIGCIIIFQTTNIFISRLCGPEYVTVYNIAYKYLSVSLMVFNIILAPIWSAFTDAYTKKDKIWMQNIYNRLVKIFTITAILTTIMIIISPYVYMIWLGDSVKIPFHISVLVGLYMIISLWAAFHASIINGIGKVRFQLYVSVSIQIMFLPLVYMLGRYFSLEGILVALIVTVIHCLFWSRYQVLNLINGTAKGIFNN